MHKLDPGNTAVVVIGVLVVVVLRAEGVLLLVVKVEAALLVVVAIEIALVGDETEGVIRTLEVAVEGERILKVVGREPRDVVFEVLEGLRGRVFCGGMAVVGILVLVDLITLTTVVLEVELGKNTEAVVVVRAADEYLVAAVEVPLALVVAFVLTPLPLVVEIL